MYTGRLRRTTALGLCFAATALAVAAPQASGADDVKQLKVTILSTMLAEAGIGEWGFSALVEADGYHVLFIPARGRRQCCRMCAK